MVQTPIKSLTLEDFLQLPETKPAKEYINHKIIQKHTPQGKHSTIQGELNSAINVTLKRQKIARSFPELRCTFDGRSIVPDLSVYQNERIPRDETGKIANRFNLAPDWTIEILSPEQNQTKVIQNIVHCLKNKTQMGWLIDPEEEVIFIYIPKQEIIILDQPNCKIPVPSFAKKFELTLEQLFNWLLD